MVQNALPVCVSHASSTKCHIAEVHNVKSGNLMDALQGERQICAMQ